jgi:cysteine desulfurase
MPGTVNISFRGIEGSAIVLTAAREGVCISAGSACAATQYGGSHVLEAMGIPYEFLHGAVRISCGQSTTISEVDQAIEVVKRAVQYLRDMSPTQEKRH